MSVTPDRVGPYKILARVGQGGMGVVYKAHDERLSRVVALKVIRGFQSDPSLLRRFWKEARAAAQVSHPNVCRLYDIAEEEDHLVLVMELIEGESLAQRLRRGPLPCDEATRTALQILSALDAFHRADIVHRDLKPGNIMLSADGAKVLDFGLAKYCGPDSLGSEDDTSVDATGGLFLGTPRYASPEQFRGQDVDARSDIFSAGAILFEMLTGQPAFMGDSLAKVADAILNGPLPVLVGSPSLAALGQVVHTALAREPGERYAGAEAMAADIRSSLTMEGADARVRALRPRRLIVLPFRILRSSDEIEFLAYSLPEAITVSLASLEGLIVRSSLVAARYPQESLDLRKVVQETEVDVVLTGTLLKAGDQLRITAQLVDAASGTLIWSHSSQARAGELLQLHDELVRRVVDSVLPSLGAASDEALRQDRPASPELYELYLRANQLSRVNLREAIELYEKCVSADATYAAAWARLGRARWLWDKYDLGSAEALRAADEALQTALRLNPNLTIAHNYYTSLQVDQGRALDAMRRLLDRAERRRHDAELFAGLGHACRYCGLLQAALAAQHEAKRLDPQIETSVNHTYFMLGDYRRAMETSDRDFGFSAGLSFFALGRPEEALAILREREQQMSSRLGKLYLASLRALVEGKHEESRAASVALMGATFRDPEGMYYQARQLSYLGAEEEALEMLARSIRNGFFCYPAFLNDPWFDRLRARAPFTKLLQQAEERHREGAAVFASAGGNTLLGIRAAAL
ncbi:MAG TPA: protein kinase [Methylomirabilota bacterium]|nr:protein kinase [Methylomirabilota bacterium]